MMYMKNLNNRFTLRVDDDTWKWICENAEIMAITPSDFVRAVITSTRATMLRMEEMTDGKDHVAGNNV